MTFWTNEFHKFRDFYINFDSETALKPNFINPLEDVIVFIHLYELGYAFITM